MYVMIYELFENSNCAIWKYKIMEIKNILYLIQTLTIQTAVDFFMQ